MKSKADVRRELKVARAEMGLGEVIEKSRLIVAGVHTILTNLNFRSLHCYEPIAKLHEVDVSELFDMPDVALYTSRKLHDEWHVVSVIDDIAKPDPQLDVIIVPMLGFDKNLHRVGYGGGYYDRLLAKYPQALKIGVCYEQGRVEVIPSETHDIPLNIIVTDETASIAV
jgi:5-formyltetrahydrofolate cyclo-ligase